jgi:hypothetical protein
MNDFVDDGEHMAALDHVLQPVLHVVAQVVEAQLVVGAVGHVAGVLAAALVVVEPMHDHADRQAEEAVDLPHPLGVALGEIVVHGHDMDAAVGERVEIDRQGGDQGLAFAGLHLGDAALVQDHAADQLHVEMPLAERALGRLAHRREGRDQDIVEGLAVGQLAFEIVGARPQRLVGQGFQLLFQRVDGVHARAIALDAPLVGGAEHLAEGCADHAENPVTFFGAAAHGASCRLRPATVPSGDPKGTTTERNDAKPFWSELAAPLVHRCPSQYGAFRVGGADVGEIRGGPALVNCRGRSDLAAANVPIPKFARVCRMLRSELRNRRTLVHL